MATNPRILLVDDEKQILKALHRQLGELYDLTLAIGPFEGLAAIEKGPPYPVIMADMRMPGMDGVQFLARARELSPNSVRMMLTGNADQSTAVQAVNEGSVFRFLNKPADSDALARAINDCLEQYRLIEAERELLEKTLSGSIRVLVDILATVNPESFGKAQLMKQQAGALARALGAPDVWQIELAAMLCHIGSVALPPGLAHKVCSSDRLPEYEASLMQRIPLIGSSLIKNIPRLEMVASAVMYQDQRYDGTGIPGDGRSGFELPLAARILKVIKDLVTQVDGGRSASASLNLMRNREGWYDLEVLNMAIELLGGEVAAPSGARSTVGELSIGDTIGSDLITKDGILLMSAGQTVSDVALARMNSYIGLRLLRRDDVVSVIAHVAQVA
jgi:response regulator RpfG family c-di-GMP phosphodiesterase